MSERQKMVALTGHRVCEHLDEDALQYELESLICEGYTGFLCGMQGKRFPRNRVEKEFSKNREK